MKYSNWKFAYTLRYTRSSNVGLAGPLVPLSHFTCLVFFFSIYSLRLADIYGKLMILGLFGYSYFLLDAFLLVFRCVAEWACHRPHFTFILSNFQTKWHFFMRYGMELHFFHENFYFDVCRENRHPYLRRYSFKGVKCDVFLRQAVLFIKSKWNSCRRHYFDSLVLLFILSFHMKICLIGIISLHKHHHTYFSLQNFQFNNMKIIILHLHNKPLNFKLPSTYHHHLSGCFSTSYL